MLLVKQQVTSISYIANTIICICIIIIAESITHIYIYTSTLMNKHIVTCKYAHIHIITYVNAQTSEDKFFNFLTEEYQQNLVSYICTNQW